MIIASAEIKVPVGGSYFAVADGRVVEIARVSALRYQIKSSKKVAEDGPRRSLPFADSAAPNREKAMKIADGADGLTAMKWRAVAASNTVPE